MGIIKTLNPIQLALLIVSIAIAVSTVLIVAGFSSSAIQQPLPFSHKIHVAENELDCTEGHTRVLEHHRATLPLLEVCQDCHSEALTETELELQLLAYTTTDEAIPWQRIYMVPDHVYFSHRRHVTLGGLACEVCHGDVGALDLPPPAPVVPITMDGCMDCHEKNQITNDCLACHR